MEERDLMRDSATNGEITETEFDPVQAINELKQNSVSKEKYSKVIAERDKYLKALIDGNQVAEAQPKEPVDINALRKDLFNPDNELSNLEYAKKALQLRDALIEKEGIDIFVGKGSKLTPTSEDYEAAQKVADAFQSCIEIADGDSDIFTRELMRITEDVAPLTSKINPRIKR